MVAYCTSMGVTLKSLTFSHFWNFIGSTSVRRCHGQLQYCKFPNKGTLPIREHPLYSDPSSWYQELSNGICQAYIEQNVGCQPGGSLMCLDQRVCEADRDIFFSILWTEGVNKSGNLWTGGVLKMMIRWTNGAQSPKHWYPWTGGGQ